MRSAIIGNGFIAKKHKEAIEKMGWEYLGAYDVVPSKSEISLEEALKADVIHICTPNVFHHQNLPEGKRLIIEKPVAISSDLVPNIDACVCYQRRFDQQAIELKELCNNAKPNQIIVNILVPRDAAYWECWRGDNSMSGGGALMNIGIHYLDLLQWWLGSDYEILEARLGKFQRGVEESCYAKMKFGVTEVEFHLNARHNVRKIEFTAFWGTMAYRYDEDEATHYDLLKGYMEGNYVTPQEAKKSLQMVEEIYAKAT